MDIMSRVFLVNEVRLYPPSERRKLIYVHSKLVTSIEADFSRNCKIFVAGLGRVEEESVDLPGTQIPINIGWSTNGISLAWYRYSKVMQKLAIGRKQE